MYLRHLTLNHYRTYARLEIELEPGVSVFIGENARGKTNLLEAIYLLAVGRVARAELDGEAIAWDASDRPPFARVAGDVVVARGEMRAEAVIAAHQGWEEEPSPSRPPRASKRFRINGVPRRLADFAGTFAATLFSVEDLAVVNGPPSG
ncbi:MAG TPA: AAA family ATPase, partial [Dehalococcoidia bacterium]|nr:AAA family ATPase [Dehalococcoidia bacterium]